MLEPELIRKAESAARNSYSPYSNFRVGAALLCQDGTVFTGTNIENRSFGLTNCAERSAFFTAISTGQKSFLKLVVICPDAQQPTPPCGACRQVISEFVNVDFPVLYGNNGENIIRSTMGKLLPYDSMHDLKER
jgi:cytidine deaminase